MKTILDRLRPVFEGEGGGQGGGGDQSGGTWAPPQGLPSDFAGADANETLGKLFGGYTDLNKRFEGMRDKVAKMPAAPEKPDLYTFEPGDKLKPFFGNLAENPAFKTAREAAHKQGFSNEQFAGFISDTYGPLVEQGILGTPFDPMTEIKTFQTATGLDAKGTQESLVAAETFAKGLTSQLKDVPDAIKPDVEAMLLGMTDTAAGNVLLRALSGRLAENGIRISGDGGGQGALTEADLKKLDADPRIDPRNRENTDPAKRFDPALRKQYDDAYDVLHRSRAQPGKQ
jgi:hypothetical protein